MGGNDGSNGYSVVTGAASGIGREVARTLAGEGRRLALTDRDEEGLASLRTELEDATPGSVVDVSALDVTDHEAVSSWGAALVDAHGAPEEVFHVAGIAIWGDPTTLPHDMWT